MAEDIPPAIHKKLVCVAKRGRFSHVVPPRVWQAADGRVLQVLDDVDEPLDEDFYKALVKFEKNEETRTQELEQQNEVAPVSTSATASEPIAKEHNSATTVDEGSSAQSATSNESNAAEPMPSHSKITTNKAKKPIKSLLGWLKQTNGEGEEKIFNETETTPRAETRRLVNGISSTRPATTINATPSLNPTTASYTTGAPAACPIPADKLGSYNASHCLIHKWNPGVRSRCFVYPTASYSTSISTPPSHPECLIWIRFGCIRLDYNLAIQQALWLRTNIPNCRVHAVAFVPLNKSLNECADARAVASAVAENTRKLSVLGIECFAFDHEEESTASPLFALWTRQRDVIGICTTESYQKASMKVTEAVSRAARCAVFAFDTENVVPVRFLETKFTGNAREVTKEEFTQVMQTSLRSLREKKDALFSFISQSSTSAIPGGHIPELILKRFNRILDGLQSMEGTLWTESSAKHLSGESLELDEARLLSHVRLGTLSPLALLLSTENPEEVVTGILFERTHRMFQAWLQTNQTGRNGSPAKTETPHPIALNQRIVDVFESGESIMTSDDDEWKKIAKRLRLEQSLSNADLSRFWQKGCEHWGRDTLRVLLRKYFVGLGASDVHQLLDVPS